MKVRRSHVPSFESDVGWGVRIVSGGFGIIMKGNVLA
jgi:hypothetical protein